MIGGVIASLPCASLRVLCLHALLKIAESSPSPIRPRTCYLVAPRAPPYCPRCPLTHPNPLEIGQIARGGTSGDSRGVVWVVWGGSTKKIRPGASASHLGGSSSRLGASASRLGASASRNKKVFSNACESRGLACTSRRPTS